MAYLQKEELKTHLYPEIVEEITREDNDIADTNISAAIDLAKSYLSRYDLLALFGDDGTAPTVNSAMLKNYVKDVACWYILTLSNANYNLELFEKKYDDAVKWMRDIQKGMSNPDWPYRNMDEVAKPVNGDTVEYSSNPKRNNHW